MHQNLRKKYVSDSIMTASPARLLVMLYDKLVWDLVMADKALGMGDLAVVNDRLCHAQDIVTELRASLRPELWEGGPQLLALYDYLLDLLVRANVTKDATLVRESRTICEPLRDAWREAAEQVATSSPSSASPTTTA